MLVSLVIEKSVFNCPAQLPSQKGLPRISLGVLPVIRGRVMVASTSGIRGQRWTMARNNLATSACLALRDTGAQCMVAKYSGIG